MRRDRESASFEYDRNWLSHPSRFSLDPALKLGPGPFHTMPGRVLFGALGDSAPDRWGRALMRRADKAGSGLAAQPLEVLEHDGDKLVSARVAGPQRRGKLLQLRLPKRPHDTRSFAREQLAPYLIEAAEVAKGIDNLERGAG